MLPETGFRSCLDIKKGGDGEWRDCPRFNQFPELNVASGASGVAVLENFPVSLYLVQV